MPQELAIAVDWHIATLLSYFGAPFQPNTWNTVFGIVPGLGMLALLYGIAMGTRARNHGLWWFALPLLVIHLFLIPISDMHLLFTPALPWLLCGLLIAQIVSFIQAWRKSAPAPWAAGALSVFDVTYIVLAAFWALIRHFNGPPAPPVYRFFS